MQRELHADAGSEQRTESVSSAFITTVKERCRMCYTCVRECPVKAIRITDGQAQVVGDRCIACGNCVRICSQHAKLLRSTIDEVLVLLRSGHRVAACIAPSFPAEFIDIRLYAARRHDPRVGIRSRGRGVVRRRSGRPGISRSWPRRPTAIATSPPRARPSSATSSGIIPDMVDSLAPIVSPMVATARVLRRMHGDDLKIVFIGPCIAKKVEAQCERIGRRSRRRADVSRIAADVRWTTALYPDGVTASEFDPPHGAAGGLFPVSRGILQAAGLQEDLMTGEIDRHAGTQPHARSHQGVRRGRPRLQSSSKFSAAKAASWDRASAAISLCSIAAASPNLRLPSHEEPGSAAMAKRPRSIRRPRSPPHAITPTTSAFPFRTRPS